MVYAVLMFFCLLTGVLAVFAKRAKDRLIPFRSALSLPGAALRTNDQAWTNGHCTAWPYLAVAGVICLIQALAIYGSFFLNNTHYVVVVSVVGLGLVFLLLTLATIKANRAAKI